MSNSIGNSNGSSNGNSQKPHDPIPVPLGTPSMLVSPDDATQALAWLSASQLTLTPAYDELPAPDAAKLRELAVSIAREGVLQPLLVTQSADGTHYEVVKGRRRWLAARMNGTVLPALVRQFSPAQKNQAFLAAHVCTVGAESHEQLTTAYDATWTTAAEDAVPAVPGAADAGIEGATSEEAARLEAVVTQIERLSPFAARHLARELLATDPSLWESLLAEARQHVRAQIASDRVRLEQELATAQDAVRQAEEQQHHQTQTLATLGQQLTEARMSYQRSEDQRDDHERECQRLLTQNRQLRGQIHHIEEQLAAVGAVDQAVWQPEVATLAQAVIEVVAAAGSPLVQQLQRILRPRTAREATVALGRALDLVEERVRVCRQHLSEGMIGTTGSDPAVPPETEE